MRNEVQLITYVDRLGGDLAGLTSLLENELSGLFGGVHLLPFFDPIDGADAGFDPSDHTRVDERLGDWNDIKALSGKTQLMADMIVNHVSSESPQFQDVLANGPNSRYWSMFLKSSDIFSGDANKQENLEKLFRPRPGVPFTPKTLNNGDSVDFWTTFSERQLDINVEVPEGRAYLDKIIDTFAQAGIRYVRLDAAGFAIKRRGTSCFMLPETFAFMSALTRKAEAIGIEILVEIHSHYQTQIDIASKVSSVYDFALPPLVLHTLYQADVEPLKHWLEIAPRNCVTVLDTHDGIGIVDAAGDGTTPGLLKDAQIDDLVDEIHRRSDGQSRQASGKSASNLDIYQVNCTYFDALGRSPQLYLLARAIHLFVPGVPQIYYVGLLGGVNDMELLAQSGVGRDINRHYYSRDEIAGAVESPMVRSLFELIRLRNDCAAFDGEFSMPAAPAKVLILAWSSQDASITLSVNVEQQSARIERQQKGTTTVFSIADGLWSAL